MNTTAQKTTIGRNMRGEWSAETNTAEIGQGWHISTSKRYSGKLVTTAQLVTFGDRGFQWSFGDKNITLISESVRVTEKAVREQHAKALILFDEHPEVKAQEVAEVYEIKPGQRVFLEGYGKSQYDGNAIIYAVEPSTFGTTYLTVDTETLELSRVDRLRDFEDVFGIGTYYIKGDIFKGSADELNNIVIEAKQREAKEKEREESARILQQQAEAGKIEEGKAAVIIPEWAKTVIVADLYENESDSMTDYFNTRVVKTVILGYSANTRNNMQELKKAALNFEETKDFVNQEDSEHTNGHSYLPDYFLGSSRWSGWKVNKAKYNFDLTTEAGKNKIYKAFAEGRYFVPTEEEKEAETANFEAVPVEAGTVQIVDYSEKSFAVIGDTKPIKDKLKELGGKFNFRLTCGAGWIFPKTKLSEVQQLFN